MCFKNKKIILLKECLLKYWDMIGNLLLYQTLNDERINENRYPVWVYIVGSCAIITSFARLMLKFRRLDIKSISWITSPMLPCERCMCNTREDGTYQPAWYRILCCGFWVFLLWLWYAVLIYPFITLFVIISIFYYNIDDMEINKLLLLYKNHNIQAFIFEDIPLVIVLTQIYIIDRKDIVVLIWVCFSTCIKFMTVLNRIYQQKLLYSIEELNTTINYNLTNTTSNSSTPKQNDNALDLEIQIQQDKSPPSIIK